MARRERWRRREPEAARVLPRRGDAAADLGEAAAHVSAVGWLGGPVAGPEAGRTWLAFLGRRGPLGGTALGGRDVGKAGA